VESFVDRLAGFLRSLFGDDGEGNARGSSPAGAGGFRDPDLTDAWEELDDYMRTGTTRTVGSGRQGTSSRERRPPDPGLRQDYANLEVAFGADIETVRRSYKRLMMKYHPDKHSGDPEKQRIALEITKKINESFERIRRRHDF
jgi:DnaJ-domain-containing protein 1